MRCVSCAILIVLALGALPAAAAPQTASAAAFDPEAATEAYLAQVPADVRARSDAYFEGGYWLLLWDFLWGLGVAALLLETRLSARMRDLAARLTQFRPVQTFLYGAAYFVLTTVLAFPLTLYQGFFRERAYGLLNQTFGGWARDQLVLLAVSVILGGAGLVVLYAVIRRAPRTWWVWGSLVTILFLTFLALIAPVYLFPLFNKSTELTDPSVRDPIVSMARANGVKADHVWVIDTSKQSNRVGGNVSGLGSTLRISLNDNLLRRSSPAGVQAVMGHEIGHYVLHHVDHTVFFFAGFILFGAAIGKWAFDRIVVRWGPRWRVAGIADLAGLPLVIALASIYLFLMTPVTNSFSRIQEAEADLFGLNAARQPDGRAEVALQHSEDRKLSPGPLEEIIFFDHPSGRNRILMAMRWKAQHLAETGVAPIPVSVAAR